MTLTKPTASLQHPTPHTKSQAAHYRSQTTSHTLSLKRWRHYPNSSNQTDEPASVASNLDDKERTSKLLSLRVGGARRIALRTPPGERRVRVTIAGLAAHDATPRENDCLLTGGGQHARRARGKQRLSFIFLFSLSFCILFFIFSLFVSVSFCLIGYRYFLKTQQKLLTTIGKNCPFSVSHLYVFLKPLFFFSLLLTSKAILPHFSKVISFLPRPFLMNVNIIFIRKKTRTGM